MHYINNTIYNSRNTSIINLLGDPCPGYIKDLRISYDISGRFGREVFEETKGYLKKNYIIETCPVVKPLIFVRKAFYGRWRFLNYDNMKNMKNNNMKKNMKKKSIISIYLFITKKE